MEITNRPDVALCRPDRQAVKDGLERALLSDMLKNAGPRPLGGSFGGGTGEEQFASLLSDLNAGALARRLDLKLFPAEGATRCPDPIS